MSDGLDIDRAFYTPRKRLIDAAVRETMANADVSAERLYRTVRGADVPHLHPGYVPGMAYAASLLLIDITRNFRRLAHG